MAHTPCGIALPQYLDDQDESLALIRRFAVRAEALNYDSLWLQESILSKVPSMEPVALLAYTAAQTNKLRLGVAVMLLTLRNPLQLAKSLATLDRLSGGRLVVGIGIGGHFSEEIFGYSRERRVTRFEEAIRVMKTLWQEPQASFQGTFWQFDGIAMEPKPLQRPHPPIWFGARRPPALRRAARMGDGFIGAGSSSTADFITQVGQLQQYLDAYQRDLAGFTFSKRVYVAIDRDKERALSRLQAWFGRHYGNADMAARVSIWGERQECLDRLSGLVEAGAQHLVLNPVYDEIEHLELLSEEIVPHL